MSTPLVVLAALVVLRVRGRWGMGGGLMGEPVPGHMKKKRMRVRWEGGSWRFGALRILFSIVPGEGASIGEPTPPLTDLFFP